VRRTAVFVTATVLALWGVLDGKSGLNGLKAAGAATVARSNDTAVATGPQIVLAHGIVQVRATITGGRVVDVVALSLPHDNPHSWAGSSAAAVKLRTEVLSKQSAQVDIVSGATFTSHGYLASLQAALDAAGRR